MDVFLLFLVNVIYQSFTVDNLLHKGRECLPLIRSALRLIGDDSGVKIHLHLIPRFNPARRLRTFNDRQSDIDGIPVKNTGKRLCDDAADSRRLDGKGCMLSGGTTAKILVGNNDIPFFYILYKILIDVFHTMGRKFLWVGGIQVSCRNDDIGIHIISIFEYMTICCFHAFSPFPYAKTMSSGPDIFPATALAAATAGLAR